MQRYCKSREIQKKRKFIFISEVQRIFKVPTLKILQIERNTKETKVYFYFRDAAYLHGANHKNKKTSITIINDRIELSVSLDDFGEGTTVLSFFVFANARDFPESFRSRGLVDGKSV